MMAVRKKAVSPDYSVKSIILVGCLIVGVATAIIPYLALGAFTLMTSVAVFGNYGLARAFAVLSNILLFSIPAMLVCWLMQGLVQTTDFSLTWLKRVLLVGWIALYLSLHLMIPPALFLI